MDCPRRHIRIASFLPRSSSQVSRLERKSELIFDPLMIVQPYMQTRGVSNTSDLGFCAATASMICGFVQSALAAGASTSQYEYGVL